MGHAGSGKVLCVVAHIDDDVETYVKKCKACQQNQPHEHETLLFSWNVPTEPWQRIHIDYAGPFEGSSWLVVVDAFSKWIEIKSQRSTTTSGTVKLYERSFTGLVSQGSPV